MRLSRWAAALSLCAVFSLACMTGPSAEDDAKEAPAKGGKKGKAGKGKKAKTPGGDKPAEAPADKALTCAGVVDLFAPLYEAEFPDQGTVDRPRLVTACQELGDIDAHQDEASCWRTAKAVMDCEWGPSWLDDGLVYDGWSG